MTTITIDLTDAEAADLTAAVAEDNAAITAASDAIGRGEQPLPHLTDAVLAGRVWTLETWARAKFRESVVAGLRRAAAQQRKQTVAEKFEKLSPEDQSAILAITEKGGR